MTHETVSDYSLNLDKVENKRRFNLKRINFKKIRKVSLKLLPYALLVGVISVNAYFIYKYYKDFDEFKTKGSVAGDMDTAFKFENEIEYRSPLNGIELSETKYKELKTKIPHVVMISNNESARDGQYGLQRADIVYEALTEGGITRFMGVYWSDQGDYWIKPIRSIRKYFLDWALEYGDSIITFSGFAVTDYEPTNALGLYQKFNPRVTIWDWRFYLDENCMQTSNPMHCKYTTIPILNAIAEEKGWNKEGWSGFVGESEWAFEDELSSKGDKDVNEFSYGFVNENELHPWRSRWTYDKNTKLYSKYEPVNPHIDIGTSEAITASTIILMIQDIQFTGDESGRVAYFDIGEGDAFVLRDGVRIDGIWKKECNDCRTRFYKKLKNGEAGSEISLKPGKVWIAAVPSNREIKWN